MQLLKICLFLAILAVATQSGASDDHVVDRLTEGIRAALQSTVQNDGKSGFTQFSCRASPDFALGQPVVCRGVTEHKGSLKYVIQTRDDGKFKVVTVMGPPDNANPELLAALRPLPREFIEQFNRRDWEALRSVLTEDFKKSHEADDIQRITEQIRSQIGSVDAMTLETFGRGESGRYEMVYALDGENGPGTGRFAVSTAGRTPRISAFVIVPRPGTSFHADLLEKVARQKLSELVGQQVERVVAEFRRLRALGDAVKGVAHLQDGSQLRILAMQNRPGSDFQVNVYGFAILDVPFLLNRGLISWGHSPKSIECPRRFTSDGESVTCEVTMSDGKQVKIKASRQGSEYRLSDYQMASP